jgi:hypothetical protein
LDIVDKPDLKIEAGTRRQIAAFLPDAIALALNSYHRFSQNPPEEGQKEFAAHHTACKVAISHIDLLIKLAKWADLPDAKAADHNRQIVLKAMMQEAQEELARHSYLYEDAEASEDEIN